MHRVQSSKRTRKLADMDAKPLVCLQRGPGEMCTLWDRGETSIESQRISMCSVIQPKGLAHRQKNVCHYCCILLKVNLGAEFQLSL